MKRAVIYDSKTGNKEQSAEWIAEGMNSVSSVEAKAYSIVDVDEDLIKEAKGIVVGSPSYATQMTLVLHNWLLMHAGKLGGAYGFPFIHLGSVRLNNNVEKFNGMENYKDYFTIYGKCFADKAVEIFD